MSTLSPHALELATRLVLHDTCYDNNCHHTSVSYGLGPPWKADIEHQVLTDTLILEAILAVLEAILGVWEAS